MRSTSHCTLPTVRHRIPSSTISRELTLSRGRVELNRLSSTSRLTLNRTGERTAAVAATGWAPLRSYSTSRCSSSRAMRLSSVCVRPSRSSSTCSRRSEQPPFRHAKPMSLTPPVVCHQPAPNSSGASPWGTALPPQHSAQRCRRQPPAVADVPWLAAAWRDGATDAARVGGCDEGARGGGRGVLPRTGQPARADRSAPLRACLAAARQGCPSGTGPALHGVHTGMAEAHRSPAGQCAAACPHAAGCAGRSDDADAAGGVLCTRAPLRRAVRYGR
jgi:hypothetical protein